MTFSVTAVGDSIRNLWNLVPSLFTAKDDTLRIDDPAHWTGELFKEVPDRGADLVAVCVDDAKKRVLAVRISVKLGNVQSKIYADSKAKQAVARSATLQIVDLDRSAAHVLAALQKAAGTSHPGFTVELRHAVATVGHVQKGAAALFESAGVAVWGRDVLSRCWIPAVVAAAAEHGALRHYRGAAAGPGAATAAAAASGGAGGSGK